MAQLNTEPFLLVLATALLHFALCLALRVICSLLTGNVSRMSMNTVEGDDRVGRARKHLGTLTASTRVVGPVVDHRRSLFLYPYPSVDNLGLSITMAILLATMAVLDLPMQLSHALCPSFDAATSSFSDSTDFRPTKAETDKVYTRFDGRGNGLCRSQESIT